MINLIIKLKENIIYLIQSMSNMSNTSDMSTTSDMSNTSNTSEISTTSNMSTTSDMLNTSDNSMTLTIIYFGDGIYGLIE
jgi:hypothetical protein